MIICVTGILRVRYDSIVSNFGVVDDGVVVVVVVMVSVVNDGGQ